MKFRGRVVVILIFVLIFFTIFFYLNRVLKPEVIIDNNFIVKSNYSFIYEHWKEEKLFKLYELEDYKKIKAKSEFEYFIKLAEWVNAQWKSSIPDPYPLSNAIDILSKIRAGKTGGFCGQYAYVYADVLKSLGFFSVRYVELWGKDGKSHFTVEVWSNQYGKWVIVDPHQAVYYIVERTGEPANAYEIRKSLYGKDFIVLEKHFGNKKIKERIKRSVYSNFAVSLRSDLMRHTKPLTLKDRFDMFLFYKDNHTELKAFKRFGGKIPYRHITERLQDIYYDCNKVRVEYRIKKDEVDFYFYTDSSVSNFKGFVVSYNNGKEWFDVSYNITIKKNYGINEFIVAPINMYGVLGVKKRVKILW